MSTLEKLPETARFRRASRLDPEVARQAKQAARLLAVAERNMTLYPSNHPSVGAVARELYETLSRLTAHTPWFTFNVFRDALLVEDEMLPEETLRYRRLVSRLDAMGIGSLAFARGLQEEELLTAVDVILGSGEIRSACEVSERLAAVGVANIRVHEMCSLIPDVTTDPPPDSAGAKRLHVAATGVLRGLEASIKRGNALDLVPAEELVRELVKEMLRDRSMMVAVANIKSHDEYTLYHSVNVCLLSMALGSILQLDPDSLYQLGLSGLMHDLGKIFVPGSILQKSTGLTPLEWDLVKRHPSTGAALLKTLRPEHTEPMIVAFEHHMRCDLQGYPKPAGERTLHLFSRIVAVCDAYDALTTQRSYRRAIPPDVSIGILIRNPNAYDPALTKAFVNLLGIYPIGSAVRLSTGETGIIVKQDDKELLHPSVLVVSDRFDRLLLPDERFVVDTAQADDSGNRLLAIAEALDAHDLPVQFTDLF